LLQSLTPLQDCSSLNKLHLDGNRLTHITLPSCSNLIHLTLCDNELSVLDGFLDALTCLQVLHVAGNQIQCLGISLGSCRMLHTLDISRNKLRTLQVRAARVTNSLAVCFLSTSNNCSASTPLIAMRCDSTAAVIHYQPPHATESPSSQTKGC
jgi:hypothetical protein